MLHVSEISSLEIVTSDIFDKEKNTPKNKRVEK